MLPLVIVWLLTAAEPTAVMRRPFTVVQGGSLPAHTWQLQCTQVQAYNLDSTGLANFVNQYAARVGLMDVLQLDMELGTQQRGLAAPLLLDYEAAALRWSPWPWDTVAGNPTLALRMVRQNNAPLLLDARGVLSAGAAGWYWLASLAWQRELRGLLFLQTYEVAGGATFALSPAWWLGWEIRVRATDRAGARFAFIALSTMLGPTLRWAPKSWELDLLLGAFVNRRSDRSDQEVLNTWEMVPTLLLSVPSKL